MNNRLYRSFSALAFTCTLTATESQKAHAQEESVSARVDLVTGINPEIAPLGRNTNGAADAHVTLLGNTQEFGFHGGVNIGVGFDWKGITFETKPLGAHTGLHEGEFEIAYSHESFVRKGDMEIGFSYSLGNEGFDELRVPFTWRNIGLVPYHGEHGPGADLTVLCGKGDLRFGFVAGYNAEAFSVGFAFYGGHSHVH